MKKIILSCFCVLTALSITACQEKKEDRASTEQVNTSQPFSQSEQNNNNSSSEQNKNNSNVENNNNANSDKNNSINTTKQNDSSSKIKPELMKVIDLAKQGKVETIPFKVGTSRKEIEKAWGAGSEGVYESKNVEIGYAVKRNGVWEESSSATSISLKKNFSWKLSEVEKALGAPHKKESMRYVYKAGDYYLWFSAEDENQVNAILVTKEQG